MATAKRNTNGVWEVISEDGDHVTFVEWLGRFFNALVRLCHFTDSHGNPTVI